MKHALKKYFTLSLLAFSAATVAAPTSHRTIVAPHCLLKQAAIPYKILATQDGFALIQMNNNDIDTLAAAKHKVKQCGGFMDVTQARFDQASNTTPVKQANQALLRAYLPKTSHRITDSDYKIQHGATVDKLTSGLVPERMWSDLTHLTSYKDRYSRSDNGVAAANWIKSQIESMARSAGRDDVTVHLVATGSYDQPSVVAKIGNSQTAGIVVGGHEDTLSGYWNNKPGADDDGSGSATVLETARVLINSDVRFNKPIYLVWYAAEEMGLVGSQYVVREFQQKNIPVDAVMQFDMTGYAHQNDPTLWLMDDYVNRDLTTYVETLIKTYVKKPVKHSRCGYACSDHASWTQGGFKSVMPFESSMGTDNPAIHTSNDTMEKLSLDHMTDYAKLALAFVGELADPVK